MSRVRGTGIRKPGIMRLTHIGVLELPVSRVLPPGLLAMPSEGMPTRLVPLGPLTMPPDGISPRLVPLGLLTMPPEGVPTRLLEIRLIPPGLGA